MTPADDERLPVLAHQRYAADRASFAGLGLAERFRRIHDTNLWGAPTSVTGLGGVRYAGVDIVPALVEGLRARAAAGAIGGEYRLADITRDPLPRADAILCRDGLVHLSFGNARRAVVNFRRSGATWLIATTFPGWATNRDCEDGDWRPLNLERLPFAWGPPAALPNEGCTEGGGGWRDKSLGAWRLS